MILFYMFKVDNEKYTGSIIPNLKCTECYKFKKICVVTGMFFLFIIPVCLPAYPQNNTKRHFIYVASISWHTGIIIPGSALPDSIWHSDQNFSQYDYLEIGWGDRDFYQHQPFNLWYATKAVLWPTRTALHINPVRKEYLNWHYSGTDLVKIVIQRGELNDLIRYIISHIKLNERNKVIPLQKGIYTNSQFVAGSSTYYFPKNSNVWAARALKRAGIPFIPILYQTTGMVLKRAGKFGEYVEFKNK